MKSNIIDISYQQSHTACAAHETVMVPASIQLTLQQTDRYFQKIIVLGLFPHKNYCKTASGTTYNQRLQIIDN